MTITGKLPTLEHICPIQYTLVQRDNRVRFEFSVNGFRLIGFTPSLAHTLVFFRNLRAVINDAQPGTTYDLPDGDPNEVDAMKVSFEADQIQKGIEA